MNSIEKTRWQQIKTTFSFFKLFIGQSHENQENNEEDYEQTQKDQSYDRMVPFIDLFFGFSKLSTTKRYKNNYRYKNRDHQEDQENA